MTGGLDLRLVLAARPQSLALVRQALAGLGDAAEVDDRSLADVKQVATEICKNVVVHAYSDSDPGRFEVAARVSGDGIELRVRDWGRGFEPRPAQRPGGSLRLGLPLIISLTSDFTIRSIAGGGTEVTALIPTKPDAIEPSYAPPAPRDAELDVAAGPAAQPVIARVIAMAAARAGLSVDRLSDTVLLGDAIAAHDPGDFPDGRPAIEVDAASRSLHLRIGPFNDGGAVRLIDELRLPGLDASLGQLADRIAIEQVPDGRDTVVIQIDAR